MNEIIILFILIHFKYKIDWLIDFNGRLTHLGLFYSERKELHLLYAHTYIFCVVSLKIFLHKIRSNMNDF